MARRRNNFYQNNINPFAREKEIHRGSTASYKGFHQEQPDSLQKFQWELQSMFERQRQRQMFPRKRAKRSKTEFIPQESQESFNKNQDYNKLKTQLSEIKQQLRSNKRGNMEDKLDQLMKQVARSRSERINTPPPMPFPISIPFYPPPYYPHQTRQPQRQYPNKFDESLGDFKKKKTNGFTRKSMLLRKFRKYAFVVVFTVFLKSESKKLSQSRKNQLKKFYRERFDPIMLKMKNWIVEGNAYSLPVILQKQQLNLDFINEKNQEIKTQKQILILKIVNIGCEKMRQDCTSKKLQSFIELIFNLCHKGSFPMSRFWSAYEMEQLCISQFYGCLRLDSSLEKFLICLVIFVKMLVFNLFLQPHKFDPINFHKSKQPLQNNMRIISSVYYRIAKQILQGYLEQQRDKYYKLGNWLNVKADFIVQCCQPLVYKADYPEEGEYISGMLDDEDLVEMKEMTDWKIIRKRIEQIIDAVHKQMIARGNMTRKNMKYKLYN